MQKLWNKWILFINENLGRKFTCMMVPIMCIVVSVTILLVSFSYTRRLIDNIERSTQYVTETFKLNMDFCTADVKNTLNVLSLDADVKYLVTMDLETIPQITGQIFQKHLRQILSFKILICRKTSTQTI